MTTQPNEISVLVVEDEAMICEWVAETLIDAGFTVHAVGNAREALEYLASSSDLDALFTDINLPGDMDGSQLAVLARELRPDLTVIYASGRVRGLDPLMRVPGSTFIPKPYMPSEISSLLTRIVTPGASRPPVHP